MDHTTQLMKNLCWLQGYFRLSTSKRCVSTVWCLNPNPNLTAEGEKRSDYKRVDSEMTQINRTKRRSSKEKAKADDGG